MKKHFGKVVLCVLIGLMVGACSKQGEPMPAEQNAGEESTPVVSGACGVEYFPVLPDQTWTYRLLQANNSFVESRIWYEDITDNSFVWKQEMDSDPPIASQTNWTCSGDGLISTDFVSTNIPMVMQGMGYDYDYEIETIEFSGIAYPANDQWFVGSQWTGSWVIESDINVENVGLVHATINATLNNTIGAEESVTVPLATYEEAARVDSTLSLEIKIEAQGMTLPTVKEDYALTSWFVRGVGLVKQISDDIAYSMELISLE
jgi:hypothetical protein